MSLIEVVKVPQLTPPHDPFTVTDTVPEAAQPLTLYPTLIVTTEAPCVRGSKLFPVTLGPENVNTPPAGTADTRDVRRRFPAVGHVVGFVIVSVAVGETVKLIVFVSVHPQAL